MKLCFYLFLGFWSVTEVFAQFHVEALTSAPKRQKIQNTQILALPFWDDFSRSNSGVDTLRWIGGSDVYVNDVLGQNPPTYRVATFDGLRANGQAHNITNGFTGQSDSLISQVIQLSAVPIGQRNTVYMSFFWQAGGFGEIPDDNDSLRLQFLRADSTWTTVWSQTGGASAISETFNQVIIPVDQTEFYHNQFRIKFQSFTSLKGPFDTWHIDYVYINANRSAQDLTHFDRALSTPPTPLFAPYQSVPATVYFSDPSQYTGTQVTTATNLDNIAHPLVYNHEIRNLTTGELYISELFDSNIGTIGGLSQITIPGIEQPILPQQLAPLDSQVIESTFYWQTGDTLLFELANGNRLYSNFSLAANDTIRKSYTLHNYYAYDDGSAEFAVALNILRGQVAMRYVIGQPDTLTHLDIYFPNIAPDAKGNTVDLIVWSELNKNKIFLKQPFTIQTPNGLNAYTRIKLNTPVLVTDTIYLGFQQFTDSYLGIGFDRSNPMASQHIFSNTSGIWEQNDQLSGALMIRPVFGYDSTFVLANRKAPQPLIIYPNPTSGSFRLNEPANHVALYSIGGQLLFSSENQGQYDVGFLPNGVYLLEVQLKNTQHIQKLIIHR